MLTRMPLITLTTDFGYKDPFVGMMKGAIFNINPSALIVDITHDINPYNIREAAIAVDVSHSFFPPTTVHVVVVDPGVGSNRRPILVVTDQHYFVGPDNGVFSLIYTSNSRTLDVRHIISEHYFLPQKGSTFHGRDIFAPVAAWLTKGIESAKFGDIITDYVTLPFPSVSMPTKTTHEGEVIYIDRFGNAITNIKSSEVDALYSINPEAKLRVLIKGKRVEIKNYYSQVSDKELYALINSSGYLELFVYRGNAAGEFNIKTGDTVGVILNV
ncbi:MAG: SAM-dependent chlorinase/fluorinase [Nitrospirae bacterium]|nr:SAM-dependent chlorinase/fluorinase [Nitrospirota bacterium]